MFFRFFFSFLLQRSQEYLDILIAPSLPFSVYEKKKRQFSMQSQAFGTAGCARWPNVIKATIPAARLPPKNIHLMRQCIIRGLGLFFFFLWASFFPLSFPFLENQPILHFPLFLFFSRLAKTLAYKNDDRRYSSGVVCTGKPRFHRRRL